MSNQAKPKIVVAVNKRLEPGRALNAAAHATIGLAAQVSSENTHSVLEQFSVIDYATADDNGFLASALSLIVLRAAPAQLTRLRANLLEAGLPAVGFHAEMTGGTYEEQLVRSAARTAEELELYAVATLGAADAIDPLTRRCSLY